MCGIAGVFRFDGKAVDPGLVGTMARTMVHRGPDAHGQWVGGSVGLGHRRLSIIDPESSLQPMTSADGRYTIVFNGEIFNYQSLRTLAGPLQTNGDTEVVLELFARRGVAALDLLRGQFALAIHDRVSKRLTLAKDRVGVLPVYYTVDGHRLAFGSEIKALWPAMSGGPSLDRAALRDYLVRRAVPAPRSMYDGVYKLPPGHVLTVDDNGDQTLRAYWRLPEPADVLKVAPSQAVDLVDRALQDAVQEAMVADVPVGSYLSGGVDSSLIVSLAHRFASESLHTFCASFGDPRFDETRHAQLVSELVGTTHHEVAVSADDFQRLWPTLTWHRDAPLSEPADIAVFRLAQDARQHVKVALSGEGSDELFGGYDKYRMARFSAAVGVIPAMVRTPLMRGLDPLLPARGRRTRIAARSLAAGTTNERLTNWFAPFTTYEVAELLGPDTDPTPDTIVGRDPVDLMSRLDISSWLPDNLLERGDRMSMAASLELRPPFLDHRLVELAGRLPSNVKVRGGQTKWVVKQVARRYLPASITDRRKVGFRVPLDAWFRSGLEPLTRDMLLARDSLAIQIFGRDHLTGLVDDHRRGRRNEESRIWTLLTLEQWYQTCVVSGPHAPTCETDGLSGAAPVGPAPAHP